MSTNASKGTIVASTYFVSAKVEKQGGLYEITLQEQGSQGKLKFWVTDGAYEQICAERRGGK